jgi:hypothetical protein
MAYGNEEGENMKFKHKKNLILKLKMNTLVKCFAFQRSVLQFQISHP